MGGDSIAMFLVFNLPVEISLFPQVTDLENRGKIEFTTNIISSNAFTCPQLSDDNLARYFFFPCSQHPLDAYLAPRQSESLAPRERVSDYL